MLDDLDTVAWNALSHAYGRAADLPDHLRALVSPDPEERRRGLHQLYARIAHQGTRFEATAHAVPFLVRLAADTAVPDRVGILELLGAIAVGYDESWLPNPIRIDEVRAAGGRGAEILARTHEPGFSPDGDGSEDDGSEDDGSEDDEPEDDGSEDDGSDEDGEDDEFDDDEWWADLSDEDMAVLDAYVTVLAYDAIRAELVHIRPLLADPDPAVRTAAAYLLAWFPDVAETSITALSTVAEDADEGAAAAAIVAAGLLGREIAPHWATDDRPLVRWAAAIAAARVRGHEATPDAVRDLLDWAGSTAGSDPRVPFLAGDVSGYAGLALGQVSPEHLDEALTALLQRLPSTSGKPALAVAGEALRRVFGASVAAASYQELDDRQQRVVAALADATEPWLLGGHPFGNFFQLMRAYGLPGRREELAAYVDIDTV